jgi:hypothetical protein
MYMPEELLTVVKIPLVEIENSIRTKHALPGILVETKIEKDALFLYFGNSKKSKEIVSPSIRGIEKRNLKDQKRNRVKTKGWKIVAKIINSNGQKCAVYKPFVDALNGQTLNPEEQRLTVQRILESNGNTPSEKSIKYFLENTLEYLQSQRSRSIDGFVDSSLATPEEKTKSTILS